MASCQPAPRRAVPRGPRQSPGEGGAWAGCTFLLCGVRAHSHPRVGLGGHKGAVGGTATSAPSSLPYHLRSSSSVHEDVVHLPALLSHPCSRPLQLWRRLLLLHVHLPSHGNLRQKACPSLMLSLSNCVWLSLAEDNLQAVLFEGCCKNQWQYLLNSLHEGYLAVTQGSFLKAQTSDLQWAGVRELQKEMH